MQKGGDVGLGEGHRVRSGGACEAMGRCWREELGERAGWGLWAGVGWPAPVLPFLPSLLPQQPACTAPVQVEPPAGLQIPLLAVPPLLGAFRHYLDMLNALHGKK